METTTTTHPTDKEASDTEVLQGHGNAEGEDTKLWPRNNGSVNRMNGTTGFTAHKERKEQTPLTALG